MYHELFIEMVEQDGEETTMRHTSKGYWGSNQYGDKVMLHLEDEWGGWMQGMPVLLAVRESMLMTCCRKRVWKDHLQRSCSMS